MNQTNKIINNLNFNFLIKLVKYYPYYNCLHFLFTMIKIFNFEFKISRFSTLT